MLGHFWRFASPHSLNRRGIHAPSRRSALWVRATTPYTISFDEASKLAPEIRQVLMSFPQTTTVANELGRPDDGTDPTGFFNDEFFVGLKPYDDPAWKGEIRSKPQLIEAIQSKLSAFPALSSTTPSPRRTPWMRRKPA